MTLLADKVHEQEPQCKMAVSHNHACFSTVAAVVSCCDVVSITTRGYMNTRVLLVPKCVHSHATLCLPYQFMCTIFSTVHLHYTCTHMDVYITGS